MTLEIAIDSIVTDNTAYTALVTLRRIGYPELARVERTEVFTLDVNGPASDAGAVVEQVSHAEVLFNPNKHRISYAVLDCSAGPLGPGPDLRHARAKFEDGSNTEWEALVSDRDDDTSGLVRLLTGPFGIARLRALKRGIAWRLYGADGSSAPKARVEWACRELLANPYSQTVNVRPAPRRTPAVAAP